MALAIDVEECVICGACEPMCPNQAISHADNIYVINFKSCTECEGFFDSPQCVSVCPVDCIHPAKPMPPIPTVRRAKLYQQVVTLFNKPDNKYY